MLLRITTAAVLGMSFLLLGNVPASAGHENPLYRAACEYRDSVREFETLTDKFRCVDRYTETAVDRLYGVSNSLRATAKNPRNFERVLDRYYEAVGLHQRIDVGLTTGGPVAPPVAACWNTVQQRFAILSRFIESGTLGGYGARGYGSAGFNVTPAPVAVPSPYGVAPTPYRAAPIPRPSTSYRQDPFGPSPFTTPYRSQRSLFNSYQGAAPEQLRRWDINPSAFDQPTRRIADSYRDIPSTRSYGSRQISSPRGDILRIGAQLMRLLD